VFFRRGDQELQNNGSDEWMALLPKIEKVAVAGDGTARNMAIQWPQRFPESHEFLVGRIDVETSPEILMRLVYRTEKAEFSKQLNLLLLKLLKEVNCEVRDGALSFIGFNSYRAPMRQIDFDRSIFDATVELTTTESAKERAAAAYALTEIRKLDMRRSRESFLQMAEDDSERRPVAYRLVGHRSTRARGCPGRHRRFAESPIATCAIYDYFGRGAGKVSERIEGAGAGNRPQGVHRASEKHKQLSEAKKAK
jgi:hypothetical protein